MNRTHKFRQGMLMALAMFTAVLVFAAPQRCADALHAGLVLCGGPLLVSLFPFLIVSALLMGCGAGPLLGFAFQPAARAIGVRAKAAGSVLLIGFLGGFAPAAAAVAQAVHTGQLTPRQASALLPACVCSGPSFVILTVGEQMLGSRALGVRLFAAQLLAGYLTAAVLCLTLKKDQPAFAFLVSVCAAAGVLAAVLHQAQPVLDWLDTWDGYFQGAGLGCLVRVLGIALAAQFAADTCREAGMAAAATAAELGGRILALLQALPLLQELLDCFAGYLQ